MCTGNTFRSASAEYLLKAEVQEEHNSQLAISSAGTLGDSEYGPFPKTIERVKFYGGDMSRHKYTILTQEIVDDADIIICMAQHHVDFVKKNFGKDSILFNELVYGKKTDIKDDNEARGEYSDLNEFIVQTVDTIQEGIPLLAKKLEAMNL